MRARVTHESAVAGSEVDLHGPEAGTSLSHSSAVDPVLFFAFHEKHGF